MTTTIREILGNRPLHAVAPEVTVQDAARRMAKHHVGAVVVVEDGQLVGILSERDVVFRACKDALPIGQTPVRAIMTADPVTIDIDSAVSQALLARLGDQFRHLPVTEDGKPVGVLSYGDIPAEYVMMLERFREMSSTRADSMS